MVWAVSFFGLTAVIFGVHGNGQAGKSPLFAYETNALTDDTLKDFLDTSGAATDATLFAFDDERVSSADRLKSGACKVFPGDANWPSQDVWRVFDKLIGGALIETVPLAAPCYQNLGVYSSEKCAVIHANWTNAYLQYVFRPVMKLRLTPMQ